MATTKKRRRKFWFVPRFGLRTFLVVVVLLGAGLAPLAERTRRQMRVCSEISSQTSGVVSYQLDEPPRWLQWLPQSWLNAADGHWCRSVSEISLIYRNFLNPMSDAEARALCKRHLELAAQLSTVSSLRISSNSMHGDQSELTDMLSPLAHIRSLKELSIDDSPWLLQSLPKLPKLTSLTMGGFGDNRIAIPLQELLKFPNLQVLSFDQRSVEGNDLSALAKLKHLQRVSNYSLVVTPSQMECLIGHPSLQYFDMSASAYTDDVFKILATFPNLQRIFASDSLITDRGLSYLAEAPELQVVNFTNATISDKGFAKLCHCKSLQDIQCVNCRLTDTIGPALAQLPDLRSIDLRGTLTSSKLLSHLVGNKILRQDANRVQVGERRIAVDELLAFFDVQTEYSDTNAWTCASYLFGYGTNGKNTEGAVDLSVIQGLHGRLGCLANANDISDLNLRDTDIDDSDLKALAPLLQQSMLDISNTNCTANGIASLAQQGALSSLTIGPMDNQEEVIRAISQMHSLEVLVLRGNWSLSEQSRSALLGMSNLESFRMEDCDIDVAFAEELCHLPRLGNVKGKNLTWDPSQIESLRSGCSFANSGMPILGDESDLSRLANSSISNLSAAGLALSPSAITKISQMNSIRELDLSNTGIVDSQIVALTALKNLEKLDLSGNAITDASIPTLLSLGGLSDLKLADTRITNQGLNQIMSSMYLELVDVSGTATDEKAWNGITVRPFTSMVCGNLPDLPKILTQVPVDLLPTSMHIGRGNFEITAEAIKTLRSENPDTSHGSLTFTPETIGIWPPEKMLVGKDRHLTLSICGTSQLSSILKLADKHIVSDIQIVAQKFDASETIVFPKTTRNVTLRECAVTTQVLQSLAKCQWLRSIQFDSCDLKGCDLKPLQAMPMLCELSYAGTTLSPEQESIVKELQPTLIEVEESEPAFESGPFTHCLLGM